MTMMMIVMMIVMMKTQNSDRWKIVFLCAETMQLKYHLRAMERCQQFDNTRNQDLEGPYMIDM